jgi:hypothetical protein
MTERIVGAENQSSGQKHEASYRYIAGWALDSQMPSDILYQLERRNVMSEEEVSVHLCQRLEKAEYPNISDDAIPTLKAQLRAVDYLYGTGRLIVSEEANPLVDILALITNPKFLGSYSNDELTTEGEPLPKPLFAKADAKNKGDQRTFDEYSYDRHEYRTITKFGEIIPTTIRGLYVMAEASKAHPSILRSALAQYESLIPHSRGHAGGMALGLLEILHNAHLLYDKRYYNFTTQLRDIVLDKIGDYRNLKSRYSYTIVADKPFWYRGRKKGRGTMTNLNIFLHQTAYL